MNDGLYNVRPNERRDVWLAFAVLATFLGAFAMLETARDALFLAKIDAGRLPLVYLAVAAISLALPMRRPGLSGALAGIALVTIGLFFAVPSVIALYALYVWSGVVSTLVLVRFWSLLGELFSLTQAKRVYGFIGIGSVLGAIVGSGAASLVARSVDARYLLLCSAAGFLLAAGLASRFGGVVAGASRTREPLRESVQLLWRQPYAKRLAAIVMLAACALTVGDFVFKQALVRSVPASQLGATLANLHFGLNILSLLAQVLLVGFVIRRLGLLAALGVLPVLLVLGGGMMIGMGGLAAALAIKAPDAALRHTLHRTATELLFVPLPGDVRRRLKAFIDVIGQRGGQALASGLILFLIAVAAPSWVTSLALILLCSGWVVLLVSLRAHYLDVFRGQLRPGSLFRAEAMPELDVTSLETLVAALDGANDEEVLTSLEILDRMGKGRLVPALTLYHPSALVVERALCLFSRTGRTNALHIIDRLLTHDLARVRVAAVAARSAIEHDSKLLFTRLALEDSYQVCACLRANLIAAGDLPADGWDELAGSKDPLVGRVVANAIARHRAVAHGEMLIRLTRVAEATVRIAAARAIVVLRDDRLVFALVPLLAEEATRTEAEGALASFGEVGLRALAAALADRSLGNAVLWHVPKAIRRFDPACSTPVLVQGLRAASDGMVRYQIIRALEQTVAQNPDVTLDRALLNATLLDTVKQAFTILSRRVALERGAEADPRRATPGHFLLLELLAGKERHGISRIFRLLGLLYPREDFASIHASVTGTGREARASSLELLENLLPEPLRQAVLALVDDQPACVRLRGARLSNDEPQEYEAVLDGMLTSRSESIVDIAVFHIGELGLGAYRDRLSCLEPRPDVRLALHRLSEPPAGALHAC